ncbi:MAG TPA: hypothetical protein VF349_08440 [Candidatus Limnocylindrales bacterium]
MKRLSPATVALVVVAGLVILADGVVVFAPAVLADPAPSGVASPSLPAAADPVPTEIAEASPTAAPSWNLSWPGSPAATFQRPTPAPSTTRQPWPSGTPTPQPTPVPTPRDTVWNARIYVQNRIGVKQYGCVNAVWTAESKWNPQAGNAASGPYGIPQAYPGSKMAAFGSNWRYSPLTQVKWGIWYVYSRYGSACNAYSFWRAHGWY